MTKNEFCALTHTYVDNGDGTHNTPTCERCEIVGVSEAHSYTYDEATGVHSCICGHTDGEAHTLTDNGDGTHTISKCELCGIDGKTVEHSIAHNAQNASYDCDCGYSVAGKAFSSDIEYVVHPGEFLAHASHTYDKGIFVDDDGTVYQKFGENNGATSNYFEIRITKGEDLSVPTGRYFVLKMRSDKPDPANDTNYRLFMHNFSGHINAKMPTASIFTGDWVIYIIDLEKAFPSYYVKDTEGNYPAMRYDTIIGGWSRPSSSDYTIDLAYVAIVDSIGDVVGLIESETNIQYSEASASATAKTKTELCAMAGNSHAYTDNGNGTHTTPSCTVCGLQGGVTEAHEHNKNSEGVYVCACGYVLEDVTYYADANDLKAYSNRANDLGVKTEGGVTYHSFGPNPNQSSTTDLCITTKENAVDNSGKYLVVKIRTNTTADNWEAWFNMYVNGGQSTNRIKPQTSAIEGTGWTTIVVDLEKAGRTAVFTPDGEEYPDVQVVFAPYGASAFLDENSTVDIAYIAFCSSIDGVCNVVDQETVVYQEVTDGNGNCSTLTLDQLAALGQATE